MPADELTRSALDRLGERLKDGELTPAEEEIIRDVIRNQPAMRRRLVSSLVLSATLHEEMRHLAVEPTGKVIRFPKLAAWGLGLAAAAAVALSAVSLIAPGEPRAGATARDGGAGTDTAEAEGIAVITQLAGAVWGEKNSVAPDEIEPGTYFPPGLLDLVEGWVQIDFYSGASVVVEGPALVELQSPQEATLHSGKLVAHVPPPARGFRVQSARLEVTDLGTDFAMRVDPRGVAEVHVFDGTVDVREPSKGGGEVRRLVSGEGWAIQPDGRGARIVAQPENFAAPRGMIRRENERHGVWQEYRKRLQNDPASLVYYTFPLLGSWQRAVPNEAVGAPKDTEGAIVGCQWTEGRWPGKSALRFTNSSHRVRLDLPGTYEDLTLACWVRLDALDSSRVALLHPETTEDFFVHWTLVATSATPARLHTHFSETTRLESSLFDRRHYHNEIAPIFMKPGVVGDWHHIAVVYDSKRREVRHYVDGVEAKVLPIKDPRPLGVGTVDLGNWPYKEWARGTEFEVRNLNGCLGEFLISKRPFSAAEIREIYEVGRP